MLSRSAFELALRSQNLGFLRHLQSINQRFYVGISQARIIQFVPDSQESNSTGQNYVQQQRREMSKLPMPSSEQAQDGLKKAEHFAYRTLAKGVHLFKVARNSNEYHAAKEFAIKSFYWTLAKFQRHVVENPKVQESAKTFKNKLEEASRIEALKRKKN